MKVILIKDVAKVGRKNEVKDLADGFARNFIIARGLGLIANDKNLAKLKAEGAEKKVQSDLLEKLLTDLSGKIVKIEAKANNKGHLFASIHLADILHTLKAQHSLEIPEAMIVLSEPLKIVGKHKVELKTTPPGRGHLVVQVTAK